jgi:transposase
VVTAKFPPGVNAPFQFGPNVQAKVLFDRIAQGLPYEKIVDGMDFFCNFRMSKSTAVNIVARGIKSPVLTQHKEAAVKFMAQSYVAHFDETRSSVNGEPWWVHYAGNDRCSLMHVSVTRGISATVAANVMPHFHGVAVHDRFPQYQNEIFECDHAFCCAHLVRDLLALEQTGSKYAPKMRDHLLKLRLMAKENGGKIPEEKEAWAIGRYRRLVNQGYAETGGRNQPTTPRKKGRPRRSPERNMVLCLDKHQDCILRFAFDELVPFTNNLAERALRPLKNHLKISGTFINEKSAQNFVDLMMYIDSSRKNGIRARAAVKALLAGKTPGFIRKWLELSPVTMSKKAA